jgi:hypothetical protein
MRLPRVVRAADSSREGDLLRIYSAWPLVQRITSRTDRAADFEMTDILVAIVEQSRLILIVDCYGTELTERVLTDNHVRTDRRSQVGHVRDQF